MSRIGIQDVKNNRTSRKWTRRENIKRVFWSIMSPLFYLSPRPFWGWRRFLLRLFGAKIGADVHLYPSVKITMPWNLELGAHCAIGHGATLYALGAIVVGERATLSQGVHLCAGSHDWRLPEFPLLKQPIVIEDDCWIAADAFVGPKVTIGRGSILGARAVAMRDIPKNVIAVGNPAVIIKSRNVNG